MKLADLLHVDLKKLSERELAPVEVAVLDTGVDASHPDLLDRVQEAFEIVAEDGRYRASAANLGINNDSFDHGTSVASIIAAIAPNARLIDVRVIGSDEIETGEAMIAGFRLAVMRRFRLLNFSLTCHSKFLIPLIQLAEMAYWQNQIVVAARRNMPLLEHGIPAQLSSCIGVDSDYFSSPLEFRFRSSHPVECAARGHEIPVAAAGGKYTVQSGTSFATPAVTGICALLLGAFPDLTPFELKTALKAAAVRTTGPP